ncbi:MAG: gfo/Idh/MocA family oxidoreductase [Rhodospirillales bacterium]|nr:MAG: gfo/Idh/MocA family oxidoreductase [Rhodospirillales bacterium]
MAHRAPGPLPTAVIGVGHFGRFHAQKFAAIEGAELVAVCDLDPERAEAVAAELGTRAVTDYRTLVGTVDAVSVAVPTADHHRIARAFIEGGAHVLVEKPITGDLAEADDLIRIAGECRRVLQVGHLERFSPVRRAMDSIVRHPLYIEAHRITSFRERGTDVSIVLDLMIHDIDLVLSLVDAPVEHVDAVGAPVLSGRDDIANCRIRFANGCVASITASRISAKTERKMRLFQPNAYLSVDFLTHTLTLAERRSPEEGGNAGMPISIPGFPDIRLEQRTLAADDSLLREVEAFFAAIRNGTPPLVSGADGRRALATAMMIRESLERHRAFVQGQFGAHVLAGPGSA